MTLQVMGVACPGSAMSLIVAANSDGQAVVENPNYSSLYRYMSRVLAAGSNGNARLVFD